MRDWLLSRARRQPDSIALIDADRCESWTYHELNEWVSKRADRLASQGVEPGDRVGILHGRSPEVISASYARISRDPRDIPVLRKEARESVSRARRSNRTIVFGLGHSSIAEHAVFNFDLMDISRLAVESVESFRLASYTEKSQRYIKIGRDFVIPEEIKEAGMAAEFEELMVSLADGYNRIFEMMIEAGEEESTAKEDARYLLPLSTMAQLGLTANAREVEYMISRLGSNPLVEVRELSRALSAPARKVAPSLIRYPEPSDYFRNRFVHRGGFNEVSRDRETDSRESEVRLLSFTPESDNRLVAAIIFSAEDISMEKAVRTAEDMDFEQKGNLIRGTMRHIRPHDSVWREFEHVHMLFELTVSASCFAQLKRHRMATLTPQPYSTRLGIKVPPSVERCGGGERFSETAGLSTRFFEKLSERTGPAAYYALTNGHRRRVLFDVNLRELYHFSRLRSDRHSQWEIRALSDDICREVKDKTPLGAALLGGKDTFRPCRADKGG